MGKIHKLSDVNVYEGHDWVFSHGEQHKNHVSIQFVCRNGGCPTSISISVPLPDKKAGVCFSPKNANNLNILRQT